MGNFTRGHAEFQLPTTNPKFEKIINYIMKDGKKNIARKNFFRTLGEIKANGHVNPQNVLDTALENASPSIMVKSKRIGGAVYQIPLEVKGAKKFYYAMRWILDAARAKKAKPFFKKFAEEILVAYANQGTAVKKKEDAHKMAEANKAFAYLAKYVK